MMGEEILPILITQIGVFKSCSPVKILIGKAKYDYWITKYG